MKFVQDRSTPSESWTSAEASQKHQLEKLLGPHSKFLDLLMLSMRWRYSTQRLVMAGIAVLQSNYPP